MPTNDLLGLLSSTRLEAGRYFPPPTLYQNIPPPRFPTARGRLAAPPAGEGHPVDSASFHSIVKDLSAAMSTFEFSPPSSHLYQPTGNFSWDAPRLHKDKIYRSQCKPATTLGTLLPTRAAPLPPGPPRLSLLDRRSKSGPNVPTVKSLSLRTSPVGTVDMSTSRFSLDARSLSGNVYSRSERPSGLAQGLRAKGSRLMRRQNSKFNSQTVQWLEDPQGRPERSQVQDRWSRSAPEHSGIQSAGNSMLDSASASNTQH